MTQNAWIESRKTLCIDFNGVLDTYKGWKGIDHEYPMREGTPEFLKTLTESGYTIVVFTAANVMKVKQWIMRNGLDRYVSDVTDKKIPALCYIDDRAVQFKGNYSETLHEILNFKTFWEDPEHVEGGKV